NPGQAFGMLMNQQRVNLGPGFDPTPGVTDNWRTELRVDWTLWSPERKARDQAAEAGALGASEQVQFVESELRNAGVQAWFGLQAVRALKDVQDESILVVEERLRQTQKRMELGAALRADVLRLQVRLAQAQHRAAQADLNVQMALSGLNRLMARGPQEPLEIQDSARPEVAGFMPPIENLDEMIALALEQRRDLRAAQQEVQRLQFESKAAQRAGGPSVTAFGAYDIDGHDLDMDTDLDSYTLGLSLYVPLSKRIPARQAASRAQLMGARAQLDSLALRIQDQVNNAHHNLRVAKVQLELANSAVGTAEEAYRILAEAQDAGGATVTDVLEAQDARRQARVARVAAEFNVQVAQAQLAQALGLLW
ncbi:MAG: TolC family protein, partial [Planctomycetes bacterium]|nr:TolC family protein [Planctomycetota bacterium]